MDRRFGALALTALLLLSGCSFLGGAPGTGTPAPTTSPTPTATATASPTATPTASPTTTAAPLPDGYGPSGAENLSLALRTHRSALVASGSFTISYQASLLTGAGQASVSSVRTTNVTQARGYEATNVSNGATRERFLDDGTAYIRTDPAGGDVYYNRSSNAVYDPREYAATGLIRPALENVTYKNAERIERGNRTFFRYRASEVRNLQSLLGAGVDPSNVTSFDAAVVVAADGSVQRVAYQATVDRGAEQLAVQVRIDVVDQGGVDLGEPEWIDEARNATEN
jgi:hypothetical protein